MRGAHRSGVGPVGAAAARERATWRPVARHRPVINGILWKLRIGAPWCDLTDRYGPWQTCHDRLVRWRRDGSWDRLLESAQTTSDAVGELPWVISVDSTCVRAHQHAAGAGKQPACADTSGKGSLCDPNEALGRSRGGLTTKVHLACDGRGRPLSVVLTPGQCHDSTQLAPVLDAIGCRDLPDGAGRASAPTS